MLSSRVPLNALACKRFAQHVNSKNEARVYFHCPNKRLGNLRRYAVTAL